MESARENENEIHCERLIERGERKVRERERERERKKERERESEKKVITSQLLLKQVMRHSRTNFNFRVTSGKWLGKE